ncbi:hypothetical protein GH742_09800 [Legionella sp. MW5194]|uniref:Rab family GTPase n=1 Tax=Legionella sp. MW5194 TaxID=2662448 RepID=UPI00193D8061|nr:hypothetical protein [Legionella sp. MW5194]QRN04143.1 hypothetical protein GH742_09800 [Legionella sp. MW5194]
MGFFVEKSPARRVLVLGEEACGKRAFLLYYKDNLWVQDTGRFSTLTLTDQDENIAIVFDLHQDMDETAMGHPRGKEKYDLILIVGDLSSPHFNQACNTGRAYAERFFPQVSRMIVGTKADEKLPGNNSDSMALETSAKTGEGFNNFKRVFLYKLKMAPDVSQARQPFPPGPN